MFLLIQNEDFIEFSVMFKLNISFVSDVSSEVF